MTFREDGAAALEWAARYLERVGDLPVLAQVAPGDVRGRLPRSPPEQGEPFADVLRDLDEILCSEHAHSSVDKAAKLLGLELRKTPADDEFRLSVDLDLSGAAAVVATVGTTSTASIDPVPALAAACAGAGVWLHVDAAYAGSSWSAPSCGGRRPAWNAQTPSSSMRTSGSSVSPNGLPA